MTKADLQKDNAELRKKWEEMNVALKLEQGENAKLEKMLIIRCDELRNERKDRKNADTLHRESVSILSVENLRLEGNLKKQDEEIAKLKDEAEQSLNRSLESNERWCVEIGLYAKALGCIGGTADLILKAIHQLQAQRDAYRDIALGGKE